MDIESAAPADKLEVWIPDWSDGISCWQQCDVNVTPVPYHELREKIEAAQTTGALLDMAMVWDGWLVDWSNTKILEDLTEQHDKVYFPMLYKDKTLGAYVPWARDWSVVIFRNSPQKERALQLLQDVSIWKRPIDAIEEYQAFSEKLAREGYPLNWAEQEVREMTIAGKPIEIVCIPSTTKGGDSTHAELMIARNDRGRILVRATVCDAPFTGSEWQVDTSTMHMLTEFFDLDGSQMVRKTEGGGSPAYCSKPEKCFKEVQKAGECLKELLEGNPDCLFHWLSGSGGGEGTTIDIPFNITHTSYAITAKLQAWKIYRAVTGFSGVEGSGSANQSAAYSKLGIASNSLGGVGVRDFLEFWRDGFALNGNQSVNYEPAGHLRWRPRDSAAIAPVPRETQILNQIDCVSLNNSGKAVVFLSTEWGDWSMSNSQGSGTFDDLPLDITWSMAFDPDNGILTVTYGASANAEFSVYEVCTVTLRGANEQRASTHLTGADVVFTMDLTESADAEFQCGKHPCFHGTIGGGGKIFLRIQNLDRCRIRISIDFELGWGGHGEALNIMRWACDQYPVAGPSYTYNICEDKVVQDGLSQLGIIEGTTSEELKETIEELLDDYELPPVLPPELQKPLPVFEPIITFPTLPCTGDVMKID